MSEQPMSEQPISEQHDIAFTLNGKPVSATVDARLNLADFLRYTLRLTGTHVGCEHGVCGACNVLIDGRSARSCLTANKAIADLQREFVTRNALQCGYCTPGMLITAAELLARGKPSRHEIREALSGNYCRCTGYQAIVDAVEAVALARADSKP
jgi:carbon-monoxide dehydrogenase small subunit